MNTALEYSTRVVQEGGRRCKKSTLNDLVHLTPLRIPLMNPPHVSVTNKIFCRSVVKLTKCTSLIRLPYFALHLEVQLFMPKTQ
jgi:hypothetical protein